MSEGKGFEAAGSFSLGTTVIILYVVFVSAVFSGFATYIYRSEWHAALQAVSDGPQNLDNLIFTVKTEDALRSRLLDLESRFRAALVPPPLAEEGAAPRGPVEDSTYLADQIATTKAEIAALPMTAEDRARGRARLNALSTQLPVVGDSFRRLVSFPTIFLTLIVTIAAGGLGTVVAFSRRYYAGTSGAPSMARLFVNVGEGIAAAIAIFLFSGAGMLALTQGGGGQNEVELSPYTVAFVAFLSGFMAEDAFGSIQSAGKRIFKRDEPGASDEDNKP